MPYTPPSQRSPATSNTSSPTLSRSHSYKEHPSSPASHHGPRPALPRSVSSTSYLNKHRRSPSINDHQKAEPAKQAQNGSGQAEASSQGTAQQPPATMNKLLIPIGAVTTPPDSQQNSDDEDRGRRDLVELSELQKALQSMKVPRGGSPVRNDDGHPSPPETGLVRPALSAEARRISHSRSASEIALASHTAGAQDSSSTSSDDEDQLQMKPQLLRKKSGELVKPALRPVSRRRPSSMPGTPTYSKAVHFNDDIEQVRHFLQVDRPIAVSAGTSPVETYDSESEYPFPQDNAKSTVVEWDIRLANFPRDTFERKTQPVWVERMSLSSDQKTLIGSVAVANLDFHKSVVARFTFDYWKTTSEISAEYSHDLRRPPVGDGFDRFSFNIKLADQAHLETKTMLLCVRYNVRGQEFWDNNKNMNYQVDFIKKSRPRPQRSQAASGPLGAIPRSRHSPTGSKPRAGPSFDDEFGQGSESSKYRFGTTRPVMTEPGHEPIRLKKPIPNGGAFQDPARPKTSPAGQAFASRYDFGASLTAALSNAQSAMGDRSGLKLKEPSQHLQRTAVNHSANAAAINKPVALSSEKPDLKSPEYNELIQKYCFFGSGPQSSKGKPKARSNLDGAGESATSSEDNSPNSSGASTPPKEMTNPVDEVADSATPTRTHSPFLSRSGSPGPFTGSDITSRIDYPPYGNMDSGFFSGSHTPTAIRG